MAIKNRRTILFYSILVIILFLIDRFSKLYILNLAETESGVDIYVTSFLNFYLTWNTGIGFGLFSFDKSIIYQSITYLILALNLHFCTVHDTSGWDRIPVWHIVRSADKAGLPLAIDPRKVCR